VKQLFAFQSHPSEDLLEEYAFRRLGEEQCANVEEHLLFCGECQETLAAIDEYILLMKSATARLNQPSLISKLQEFWRPMSWPRLLWAIPAAAACLLVVLYTMPRLGSPAAPPVAVILIASHRSDPVITAPKLTPLDFQIDVKDAPPGLYRMEVSDRPGKQIWKGDVKLLDGKLQVVTPGLPKDLYWVRIYRNQSDLEREFNLRTE